MLRKKNFLMIVVILVFLGNSSWAFAERRDPAKGGEVKNVILMIGDGMGFEHVKAASIYAYGEEGKLSFEQYYRGEMTTHSANSYRQDYHATDSGAAATAMATGEKVDNDVISERSRRPIKTILEYLGEQGKLTGLITTVPITHATPAGFGAHNRARSNYRDIANDYMTQSRPNILFGAYFKNGSGMTAEKAKQGNYDVVTTRQQMLDLVDAINKNSSKVFYLAGLFCTEGMPWEYDYYHKDKILIPLKEDIIDYDTVPHLSEMTSEALRALDNDPNGFFLMVEGGQIDKAAHKNIIERDIFETLEFDRAFQMVSNWAKDRANTLIVVTADHECGGLKVVKNRGRGTMPDVFWSSRYNSVKDHTGENVPVYAVGEGAENFVGVIDNTDIFKILMKLVSTTSAMDSNESKQE